MALGIAYQRVNVDLAERHTVVLLIVPATGLLQLRILSVALHEVAAKHDHARHPEKQNLVRRYQQRGGIKDVLVARLLRPAQRRERQEAGGEPGVEHVGILLQDGSAAMRALGGGFASHHHVLAI